MIDYTKISDAVKHYSLLGYQYIEVPWIISEESMMITAPPGVRLFSTFAGSLVASGEQSFLEMRHKLTGGKYQCVTPCFRDEPVFDELHLQYFIKNELIIVLDEVDSPQFILDNVIKDALLYFGQYGYLSVVDVPMPNSIINYDITMGGIEIGSYGYRKHNDFAWIYGTGCAEPRLSQVSKR